MDKENSRNPPLPDPNVDIAPHLKLPYVLSTVQLARLELPEAQRWEQCLELLLSVRVLLASLRVPL